MTGPVSLRVRMPLASLPAFDSVHTSERPCGLSSLCNGRDAPRLPILVQKAQLMQTAFIELHLTRVRVSRHMVRVRVSRHMVTSASG
jgi:hypothetical protein